jgi:D-methionine transport system substrate-binding protein
MMRAILQRCSRYLKARDTVRVNYKEGIFMKRLLTILLTSTLVLGLAGCATKEQAKSASAVVEDKKTIVVGATPVPAAEVLKEAAPLLEKKGYKLEIKEFTDYVIPNISLNDKEIDANLFQHTPYLEKFNQEKKTDLTAVKKIYLPPLGLYSNKIKNISELKDGATIAVPNDPTNEKRALKILEKAGLIKVKDGETLTKLDITENKRNFQIKELDAPQLPRVLVDVDAAIINANYAMEANLIPGKDSIYLEAQDSPYANVLAVRTADKDKAFVKALEEVLTSPEIKKFIEEKYKGSIIPAF